VGEIRTATADDLEGLTVTLTAAFEQDPLWRWAFPDLADLEVWWRFLIRSALRYPTVRVDGDYAAVAVWIPPGGSELTEAEESYAEGVLDDLAGPRSGEITELLERFDASHPPEPEHWYLSLLGVHPSHRGEGLGMRLLAECLEEIDAEGRPTYLESSNPANDRRYERLGFRRVGEFTTPGGEHAVGTMWRDVPR
jgi:GNAT superfamily N-acetyltransferase